MSRPGFAALVVALACAACSLTPPAQSPQLSHEAAQSEEEQATPATPTAAATRATARTEPGPPTVDLARLRATAPAVAEPWPWGVDPDPRRGHRVCADAKKPRAHTHATFARTDGSASLTRHIVNMVCAAAPRATLKIAIYYVENNGQDVQRILDALSFVATRRDVAVRVVADRRRRDASPDFSATLDQLRTFAAVHNCLDGCRSELPPRGDKGGSPQVEVQHHKFMVLSDTHYSRGRSPMVWLASANWSERQLHTRSQSGFIIRDPGLAAVFSLRFDDLETCARYGCRAWNHVLRRRGLAVKAHGVMREGGIWFDRSESLWSGRPGGGSFAQFSPWRGRDPVAAQLGSLRCTDKHDTVWVAQRVIGRSRSNVAAALAALQAQGCDVRIIISSSSLRALAVFYDGYLGLRERGLNVSCVKGVHDKYLLIDAVDRRSGKVVHSITAGSQGMLKRALRFSDDALVTLTTANTSKAARRANAATWLEYRDHHEYLAAQAQPCP